MNRRQNPLNSEIELSRIAENSQVGGYDSIDQDLSMHVACFIEEVRQTLRLTTMSLDSAESARLAFDELHRLRAKVREHSRTAQLLKQLLIEELYKNGSSPEAQQAVQLALQ